MIDYRVYKVDDKGHVQDVVVIQADCDEQAIEDAKQYIDGLALEVWTGARRVGTLPKSNDHG